MLAGFGFEGYAVPSEQLLGVGSDGSVGGGGGGGGELKVLGWRGVENVDILGVETATSLQQLSRSWNKRTQGWLERYTYHRTGGSLAATYFISAFWHGLYPGYFVFFLCLPALTVVERQWRRKLNPVIQSAISASPPAAAWLLERFYDVACAVALSVVANFLSQTFHLGSWSNCVVALNSFYWAPQVGVVLLAVLLSVLPAPRAPRAPATTTKPKAKVA